MTFVSQGVSVRYLAGNSEATGSWSGTKNPRWVRTLSHLGAAICITASTSVPLRSFTTRGSRTVLRRGPVEEVPFAHFACGQHVWVRSDAPSDFDVREGHPPSTIPCGEDRYRLLTNNCEHFCEWCLRGTASKLPGRSLACHVPDLLLLATLRLVIRVPMSSLLR